MFNVNDYSLEIVCQNKENENAVYRKYDINGSNTIGVKKNEAFEIRFKNPTNQRVQLRLSVDGTDVLTGDLASTKPSGKMWVVEANSSVALKAWPETNHGGARFVFGDVGKSVAANTHGNMAGRGIIAAAVYVESPSAFYQTTWWNNAPTGRFLLKNSLRSQNRIGGVRGQSSGLLGRNDTYAFNISDADADADADVDATMDCFAETQSAVAVGAGEQVDQTITKTAGLAKPVLDHIIQVRYELWEVLAKKLSQVTAASPNAFPGDEFKGINLKKTPRVKSSGKQQETIRFV